MASSAKDIQLRELKDTISQLNTIMSEQTELIRSLRTIIEEKTAHEMVLQEQVDYLTKKLFGSSSEKTPADIPGQLNLFNEAEVYQDPELPEEDCSREPRPRKKKATHAELFKGLKVHKEVIPLDEEDKARWNVSEKNTSAGNSFLLLPNVKFMNTTRKAMAALTVRKERAIRKSL